MKFKLIMLSILLTILKYGQLYPVDYNSFYRNFWHQPSDNWYTPAKRYGLRYNNPAQVTPSPKLTMIPKSHGTTNTVSARKVAPRKVKNGFDSVPWFFRGSR